MIQRVYEQEKKDASDLGNVKVTFDKNGFALYFSRSEIPYARDKGTVVDRPEDIPPIEKNIRAK